MDILEMMRKSSGEWGFATPAGNVCLSFRDGKVYTVSIDGQLFVDSDSDVASLRAELESARVDAERYRHLKDIGVFRVLSLDMSGKHTWTLVGRPIRGEGSTIDAAIDAARGGK